MAEEEIILNFDADTEDAEVSIDRLVEAVENLKASSARALNEPSDNAYFAKYLGDVINTRKEFSRLQHDLSKSYMANSSSGRTNLANKDMEANKKAIEEMKRAEQEYQRVFKARKGITGHGNVGYGTARQYTSPSIDDDGRISQPGSTYRMGRARAEKNASNTQSTIGQFKSIHRSAMATGHLDGPNSRRYENARKFIDDPSEVIARNQHARDYSAKDEVEVKDYINTLNDQMSMIDDQSEEYKQLNTLRQQEVKNLKDIQATIRALDKEVDALQEAQEFAGRAKVDIDNRETPITVAPKEDTTKGKIYSRSASIGNMIAVGGFASALRGFSSGNDIYKNVQPTSQEIGMTNGNYDFRGIRDSVTDAGIDGGYTNVTDAMEIAKALSRSGADLTEDEMSASITAMGTGSRVLPVDQNMMNDMMSSLIKSGAVGGDSDSIKGMQEAFLGAIQQSGMQGREEEQIKMLSNMTTELFNGRKASEQELSDRMALTSVLSGTGNTALQGDNLGNMVGGLDSAIKGASPNSALGMLMGAGSEYQGLEGAWGFAKESEQGVSADILNKLVSMSASYGGSREAQLGAFSQINRSENLGMTTDQMETIFDLSRNGKLTDEALKEVTSAGADIGEGEYNERLGGYEDSPDSDRDKKEAFSQRRDLKSTDNILADIATDISAIYEQIAGSSGLTAVLSNVVSGAFAGLAGQFGAQLIGEGARHLTSGTLTSGGSTVANTLKGSGKLAGLGGKATGLWESTKGMFRSGSASDPMTFNASMSKKAVNSADDVLDATKGVSKAGGLKGLFKGTGDAVEGASKTKGLGGIFSGADDAVKATAKGADALDPLVRTGKSLGKFAGVAGVALDAVSVVHDVATAEEGQKDNALIKGVGSTGGSAIGATIGGALGSFLGPVGTVLGTMAGGWVGNKVGGWAGEKGGDLWDATQQTFGFGEGAKTVSADELDEDKSGSNAEDQANESKRTSNTKQRLKAIGLETDNLNKYEKLIDEALNLLEVARRQNGIMGTANGGSNGTSSSGSGVGGQLGYTSKGKYWTNNTLTKHDLGKTTDTLTAGQLNEWINANAPEGSSMYNMGETYMKAGRESGLDPRYLVAHSALETGWGTSSYAKAGNFYGIGAFDDNPDNALKYGNNSAERGIIEGAKWIGKNYYQEGQTTLNSMRHNGGVHEYATDPNWDTKIAGIMKGSEGYTKASSGNVNVTNNVTVQASQNSDGSIDAKKTGEKVSESITTKISNFFTRESRQS